MVNLLATQQDQRSFNEVNWLKVKLRIGESTANESFMQHIKCSRPRRPGGAQEPHSQLN
jgi:hypothetical protein